MIRGPVEGGVSIEETLELWVLSLRAVKACMRPLFEQERGWQPPWGFSSMACSEASAARPACLGHRRRAMLVHGVRVAAGRKPMPCATSFATVRWETIADAVLVIDEAGFLKQGKASCGVARQYNGSAGKITTGQIGVFVAYASRHCRSCLHRPRSLPTTWTDDPARMAAVYVP